MVKEEDLYPSPPPEEGPVNVPDLPPESVEPVAEKTVEEPPLPSWMSSKKEEPVMLAEKEVEAPPATPPEWQRPAEAAPHPHKYRRRTPDEKVRYRGAGPPK